MASYTSLERSILPGATFNTNATPSLASSTSLVFMLLIIACIAATGFVYMRGGLWRMQASARGIEKSNEEFKRGTLGLLGVLSMYLLLYTLNKGILLGDVGLDGLSAVRVGGQVGQGAENNSNTVAQAPTTSAPVATDGSEQQNRATLQAVGIRFNKDSCVGGNTSCTNVGGINPKTIAMLLDLKSGCNCDIQITGGTEPGHSARSNHGVGKEAVDISLTETLVGFLKSRGGVVGNAPPCNVKYSWDGFIFWDEAQGCDGIGGARHFHVSFTGR